MNGDVRLGTGADGQPFCVPEQALGQHTLVFGGSGFGKTFLSYVMIREQMKRGASLVALDPKTKTIRRLRGLCHELRLLPENVTVIDPARPEDAPGMNPLLYGERPAAGTVMSVLQKTKELGGDRMFMFLMHAVRVAAWHGLSIDDVPRLLGDDVYRERVLASRPLYPETRIYTKTVEFFRGRFLAYGRTERDGSVASVESKFMGLLGYDVLLNLFGARRNTVDFDGLFRTDAEQKALLVSIEPNEDFPEETALLLAGMVVQLLFAAARREPGERPVLLAVDEIRTLAGFMEEGLREVVNKARESRIRVIAAGQHSGQLPEGVRADLLVSSAVKAYFNPGSDPSDTAARDLARMAPGPEADPEQASPAFPVVWPYKGRLWARDGLREYDGPVPVKADIPPPAGPLYVDPADPDRALRRFMEYASTYYPPATLEDGTYAYDFLRRQVPGTAYLTWQNGYGMVYVQALEPPALPAAPKPKPADWTRQLRSLKRAEAFVLTGDRLDRVKVDWVEPPPDAPGWYVERSRRASAAPVPDPEPTPAPQPAPRRPVPPQPPAPVRSRPPATSAPATPPPAKQPSTPPSRPVVASSGRGSAGRKESPLPPRNRPLDRAGSQPARPAPKANDHIDHIDHDDEDDGSIRIA